ncbi:hypothetical protein J3Q64DRAFT_1638815 [Phycomyces blakesleeanus]|uniref:Autophagy-related protein 16 domain-containing protein n=1 Tax=Phycomyces blakesleeanus TaxID=4837 RepID=A0ABR3B1B9_PHYBL
MNRQRLRNRVTSRANTMPMANPPIPNRSDYDQPNIEDSLQDWLTRSISESASSPVSWLLDNPCRCCGKSDCESLATLTKAIRKLEVDTRLAAEIGQGLLHKHEAFVRESSQTSALLEQQLEESRDQVLLLENQLEENDNIRQDLTAADLETANARCLQLTTELQNRTVEIEKLRIFKFMVRQADAREETLRTKLEDSKQELALARKNELSLESKHKKLRAKYGWYLPK